MKQMEPHCLCGRAMKFPRHKNESNCTTEGCGVRWERNKYGYWAIGLTRFTLTPYLAKVKVPKDKLNRYDRYMARSRGKAWAR